MIWVIVIGARRNDDICIPLADFANNLLAGLKGRQELAVVIIEHFVFDADAPPRFLRFRAPALGECFSTHGLVPCIAVG